MSISLPSNLIISNVTLSHNTPTYYSESLDFKSKSVDRGIHRLEGTIDVTTNNNAEKRALEAFMLKVRGRANPFYIDLPDRFKSNTVISANISTNVAGNPGDNTIAVGAFIGNISAGDMFTILNDNKTYVVLDDKLPGAGLINIYPPLRKGFVSGTPLDFNTNKIYARFRQDTQTISYTNGGLIHTSTLAWMEAM